MENSYPHVTDAEITGDTYKGVEVGGPRYGGSDSVKINAGFWIRVPDFHRNGTTLSFNVVAVLPKK
jgi:hypothetical protein